MTVDDLAATFRGKTVAVAASGPSLTAEDLDLVRSAGLPLAVCNTTWRMAPWADLLVAMDTAWWREHGNEASIGFGGRSVGFTAAACKFGAQFSTYGTMIHHHGNTGAAAIAFLVRGRAKRLILLGYDAIAGTDGALHWHGAHPKPLSNPEASIPRWPKHFGRVADHARKAGVEVINCSRRTALACFQRMELEEALRIATSNGTSGSSTSERSGTHTPARQPSGSVTSPGALATAAT